MSKITLVWTDPSVRADGSVMPADEVAVVTIGMRVGGAPDYTTVGTVAAGVQTFTVTDLPAGSYGFRVVVTDTQNPPRNSAGAFIEVEIPVVPVVKAPPGDVNELTATVSAE